ncbi:hypothetical protein TNCV_31321 [Trichonephila clavipes]|nr:hypothetical protein TNCV_31321 [Trichonephila clavipes]
MPEGERRCMRYILLEMITELSKPFTEAFIADILVGFQGRDLPATFLLTQETLSFAYDWSKDFKLDFNPDETRVMVIEK